MWFTRGNEAKLFCIYCCCYQLTTSFHKLCFAYFAFQTLYSANVPACCPLMQQLLEKWISVQCFHWIFLQSFVCFNVLGLWPSTITFFLSFVVQKLNSLRFCFVCTFKNVLFICIFHCVALSLGRQNLSARPPGTSPVCHFGTPLDNTTTTWDRKEHTTRVAGK